MSEMVERVAAAIWALNEDTDCHDYDQLASFAKERADNWARAAIEAMREPTEVMVQAPFVPIEDIATNKDPISSEVTDDVAETWRAMIDAALYKEPANTVMAPSA